MAKPTITIYENIGRNNPEEAKKLLAKYGVQIRHNQASDIVLALERLTQEKGEDFLIEELLNIHPDYEAFAEKFEKKTTKPETKDACGCALPLLLAADGQEEKKEAKPKIESPSNQSNNSPQPFIMQGQMFDNSMMKGIIGVALIITLSVTAIAAFNALKR